LDEEEEMSDWQAYVFIWVGVILGVVLPALAAYMREYFPAVAGFPPWIKRYLLLLLFGLGAATILLAIWKSQHQGPMPDWYTAILVGFSWQSTIEAVAKPKP
jgi:uncharacterized membrane protein YoaK (UPF0700 family)